MDLLPSETRAIIVSFLDDTSRRWMRLANTQWFNLIQYNNFTLNFIAKKQLLQIVDRLATYNFPLKLSFKKLKFHLEQEDYEQIGGLTQLVELHIPNSNVKSLLTLTHLTNLESIPTNAPQIVRYFPKCTSLEFTSVELAKEMDLQPLSNIESLSWSFSPFSSPSDPTPIFPHKEHLTNLEVRFIPRHLLDEANVGKYSNLRSLTLTDFDGGNKLFDLPHLPYLETLNIQFNNIGSLASMSKMLTSLSIACENIDRQALVELRNLRYFKLELIRNNNYDTNAFEFLTALTNLEAYEFSSSLFMKSWGEELQYINSEKLTALQFLATTFSIYHLTKFGNLLSLNVDAVVKKLESADVLGKLTSLTSLYIHNVTADLLPKIDTLTNLKRLHLSVPNSSFFPPTALVSIEKLKKLEYLIFMKADQDFHKRVDDDAIRDLPLTALIVNWPVSDQFLKNLCTVTTLQSISLFAATNVTDEAIAGLTSLPNLSRLHLKADAGMTGVTGATLTLLTNLQELSVRSPGRLANVTAPVLKEALPKLHATWF